MIRIIIASIFLIGGLLAFLIGTIGILRLPDVFTRIHSAAKCDTLGVLLSLTGLMIFNGVNLVTLKLLIVLIFIWITNPTATHLIGKAQFLKNKIHKKRDGVDTYGDI